MPSLIAASYKQLQTKKIRVIFIRKGKVPLELPNLLYIVKLAADDTNGNHWLRRIYNLKTSKNTNFCHLRMDDNVIAKILSFLDKQSKVNSRFVCKSWKHILDVTFLILRLKIYEGGERVLERVSSFAPKVQSLHVWFLGFEPAGVVELVQALPNLVEFNVDCRSRIVGGT